MTSVPRDLRRTERVGRGDKSEWSPEDVEEDDSSRMWLGNTGSDAGASGEDVMDAVGVVEASLGWSWSCALSTWARRRSTKSAASSAVLGDNSSVVVMAGVTGWRAHATLEE